MASARKSSTGARRPSRVTAVAAGLAVLLTILAVWSWFEQKEVARRSTANPQAFSGQLSLPTHRLVLRSAAGVVLECSREKCGYRGMRDDVGKQVTVFLADGRIVAMASGGEKRNLHGELLASKQDTLVGSAVGALLAAIVALTSWLGGRGRGR